MFFLGVFTFFSVNFEGRSFFSLFIFFGFLIRVCCVFRFWGCFGLFWFLNRVFLGGYIIG